MTDEKRLLHWRHGGKITHAGVEVLPGGKDITVTIERIAFVEGEIVNGEKKDEWVCWFKENPYFKLPIILNATNKKRLAKLSGTPFLETVKNLTITLTQEMDKQIGGGRDWCLRISNTKPSQAPPALPPPASPVEKKKLSKDSPNYQQVADWLKTKGTLAGVLVKYEVDEETLAALKLIKK